MTGKIFLKVNIIIIKNIISMKWLLRLFKKEERLKLGDKVTSVNNFYSKGVCVITRIYDRKSSGEKIKYCRLEFKQYGFKKVINVTYKSCKKVNLNV